MLSQYLLFYFWYCKFRTFFVFYFLYLNLRLLHSHWYVINRFWSWKKCIGPVCRWVPHVCRLQIFVTHFIYFNYLAFGRKSWVILETPWLWVKTSTKFFLPWSDMLFIVFTWYIYVLMLYQRSLFLKYFCISLWIPLDVSLFQYIYRLKTYIGI